MKCPYCKGFDDKVIDSRISKDARTIRRRRECLACQKRFTTHESIEETLPSVIKTGDKRREPFDRKKILDGLKKACQKRDISMDTLSGIVDNIEKTILETGVKEIKSTDIGETIMKELHELDEVAYVRFASVYRSFKDISDFMEEFEALRKAKEQQQAQ